MKDKVNTATFYTEKFDTSVEKREENEHRKYYNEHGHPKGIVEALILYDNAIIDFLKITWLNILNDQIIVRDIGDFSRSYIDYLNKKRKVTDIFGLNVYTVTKIPGYMDYSKRFILFIANELLLPYSNLQVSIRLEENWKDGEH